MSAASLIPGLTLCAACRTRDAEVTEDPGERWQRHLCFECADDVVDRMNANGINPEAFDLIRRARKDIPARPTPRFREPGMIW